MNEPGPLYAAVTAKAADVTGDGKDELLLGYRNEGTGMILDLDIVGTDAAGAPRVLAHDDLYKGNVVLRHGRLVTYTPDYKKTDANCCPTWIVRDVLRYRRRPVHGRPGRAGPHQARRRATVAARLRWPRSSSSAPATRPAR